MGEGPYANRGRQMKIPSEGYVVSLLGGDMETVNYVSSVEKGRDVGAEDFDEDDMQDTNSEGVRIKFTLDLNKALPIPQKRMAIKVLQLVALPFLKAGMSSAELSERLSIDKVSIHAKEADGNE